MRLKAMKENKNVFNGKRNRLQLNLDGGSVFINASSVVGVYKLIKSLILWLKIRSTGRTIQFKLTLKDRSRIYVQYR